MLQLQVHPSLRHWEQEKSIRTVIQKERSAVNGRCSASTNLLPPTFLGNPS